jgi:hypothetical protein
MKEPRSQFLCTCSSSFTIPSQVWGLIEIHLEIVTDRGVQTIKNSSNGIKDIIPLMQQPTDPLHKKFPGLPLKPLQHHSLDPYVWPRTTVLWCFLEGSEYMNSVGDTTWLYLYGAWSNTF